MSVGTLAPELANPKSGRQEYVKLSCLVFVVWAGYSFTFSFFPIWLSQNVGLTGTETGIVFSLNAVVSLLIQPVFGYIQDKLGRGKQLIYLVLGCMTVSAPFLLTIYKPLLIENFYLGAFIGGVFFSFVMFSGGGLIESYSEKTARVIGSEFGRIRMWGSLGWAMATLVVGQMIAANEELVFWLATMCGVLGVIAAYTVGNGQASDEARVNTVNFSRLKGVITSKKFFWMSIYVVCVSSIYSVYDQQFPIYFTRMFEDVNQGNETFGYLNSLQVFLEAGGMFLAPFFVNKIGAKNSLIIAGLIMMARISLSAITDSTLMLSLLKLIHSAELPLLIVAIFKYIERNFDKSFSSTLYLFGYLFMTQLSLSVFSPLFGNMYDTIGFQSAYMIMGSIIAGFVLVSSFTLESDHNQGERMEN
jgi:OHS family lactose permease-like MFS transporter